MSQFLQTQALVMTSYLQGVPQAIAAAGLQALDSPAPRADLRIAPAAAAPVAAMAPIPMPPPVAAVRPPAAVQTAPAAAIAPAAAPVNGGAPAAAPPPAVPVMPVVPAIAAASKAPENGNGNGNGNGSGRLTEPDVLRELLRIVSDRTGYPPEMLTVDANIESDLGIDSIKRMEILAAFHEAHGGPERGAFQDALERLTALKTLRESASALAAFLAAQPATVTV